MAINISFGPQPIINLPGASGPLAALYNTSNKLTTVNYPLELATDSSKAHYVTFFVREVIPADYKDIITKLGNIFGEAATDLANAAKAAAKNPMAAIDAGVDTVAKNGQAISNAIAGAVSITKNRSAAKAFISLYMPDTLQATYHADYADISLSDELGTLNSISGIAQVTSAAMQGYKKGDTMGSISSDPNTLKYLIGGVSSLFGVGAGAAAAALQAQGFTSNPQLQMIYRGASFRTFSLSFIFTPKSREEAAAVENIIYQFKYYAAPKLQSGVNSPNASMFLIPPALFQVKFYHKNAENVNLPKYTDCVLQDIAVDYAPNGWAAHTDGAPIQTHLSLSFQEVEIVDKDRLATGYLDPSNEGGLR